MAERMHGKQFDRIGIDLFRLDAHHDHRGYYVELWNAADGPGGIGEGKGPRRWHADDVSVSRKGVLRGIHGDAKTWKLVTCLHGAFYLVVVDWREGSGTHGSWAAWTLSDRNLVQVLVPPGFGNGHLVLSDEAVFYYKQSEPYDRASQFTLAWDDPDLGIFWPTAGPPILSERDAEASRIWKIKQANLDSAVAAERREAAALWRKGEAHGLAR